MSSRPLFAVGEDVWLASKSNPQLNNPTRVVKTTETPSSHCAYGYFLDIPTPLHPWMDRWCECALRKRPDPGSSFESIMDELTEKVPA